MLSGYFLKVWSSNNNKNDKLPKEVISQSAFENYCPQNVEKPKEGRCCSPFYIYFVDLKLHNNHIEFSKNCTLKQKQLSWGDL